MTQERLNNCMLLHVHKDLTDNLNLEDIATAFITAKDERLRYFGTFLHLYVYSMYILCVLQLCNGYS